MMQIENPIKKQKKKGKSVEEQLKETQLKIDQLEQKRIALKNKIKEKENKKKLEIGEAFSKIFPNSLDLQKNEIADFIKQKTRHDI